MACGIAPLNIRCNSHVAALQRDPDVFAAGKEVVAGATGCDPARLRRADGLFVGQCFVAISVSANVRCLLFGIGAPYRSARRLDDGCNL